MSPRELCANFIGRMLTQTYTWQIYQAKDILLRYTYSIGLHLSADYGTASNDIDIDSYGIQNREQQVSHSVVSHPFKADHGDT